MMQNETVRWHPFKEPLGTTVVRNTMTALAGGAALAWSFGDLTRWPLGTVLMLWPSFGGHFLELLFLNVLRPRLPSWRVVQTPARLMTWLVGGTTLALAMSLTARALASRRTMHWLDRWWLGGLAFVAVELAAHIALQLRGKNSFYNSRG